MILKIMRARLQRYRQAVVWLVGDGLRANWGRVIGIFFFQLLGVLAATASMGLVLGYIHWAQDPYPIIISDRTILETPDRNALLLASAAALVMGILSAVSLYLGDYGVARLTRGYQRSLLRRLLEVAVHPRLGAITILYERRFFEPIILRDLIVAGARFTALSVRALVQLFLPALTLVIAAIVLFAVDHVTTLILSTLIALYLLPLYRINHRVARHHRAYRRMNRVVSKSILGALAGVLDASGPAREFARRATDGIVDGEDFRAMQEAFYGRMLAAKRVALLNGVFLILLVVMILLLFAGEETISWSRLLAYIIALRFAWTSVRQVTALLTGFNQFFSEVEKVAGLIRIAREIGDSSDTAEDERLTEGELVSSPRSRGRFNAADRIPIGPGSVVLAINPRSVGRATLEHTAQTLAKPGGERGGVLRNAVLHDQARLIDGVSLLAHVFGDDSATTDERGWLVELLRAADQLEAIEALPRGVETLASPETHQLLSRHTRALIGIAWLLREPPPAVVLTLRPFVEAPTSLRREVLRRLRGGIVIVVDADDAAWSDERAADLREATTGIAVLLDRDEVVVGDCSWFERNREALHAAVARLAAERSATTGGDAADDPAEIE